ncbi:hypothetical protein quinque_011228 [Culex quinquefasciatus]
MGNKVIKADERVDPADCEEVQLLSSNDVSAEYARKLDERINEDTPTGNLDERWRAFQSIVNTTATEVIGATRGRHRVTDEMNEAREFMLVKVTRRSCDRYSEMRRAEKRNHRRNEREYVERYFPKRKHSTTRTISGGFTQLSTVVLEHIEPNFKTHPNAKKVRCVDGWARTKVKKLRQSGQPYINRGKKEVPQKHAVVGDTCGAKCPFKCTEKIGKQDRIAFNKSFWERSDEEKRLMYALYVTRRIPKRPKNGAKNRKNTFVYSMPQPSDSREKVRVCRTFFLQTLNVSAARVRYFFEQQLDGPRKDPHGCHVKKTVPHDAVMLAKQHILSFETGESHYARRFTTKIFLERDLSKGKLYELFQEMHGANTISAWKYRSLINQLNMGFVVPKNDLCATCFEKIDPQDAKAIDALNTEIGLLFYSTAKFSIMADQAVVWLWSAMETSCRRKRRGMHRLAGARMPVAYQDSARAVHRWSSRRGIL